MTRPATFILTTARGSILCENGEWIAATLVGPNQHTAKTYRTRSGAERAAKATGRDDIKVMGA